MTIRFAARTRAFVSSSVAVFAVSIFAPVAPTPAQGACPGDCPVPGRGSKRTDCISEFTGLVENFPVAPKTPRKLVCVDGDPSCDNDATVDGTCRFRVGACFNNDDPRFPDCSTGTVTAFEVRNRPPGHKRHEPGLAAMQEGVDSLLPISEAICAGLHTVDVALRARANGTFKRGRGKVKTVAELSDGTRDSDRIKMFCEPAAPRPSAPACARAKIVDSPAELIDGPLARGRLGDILLENDEIRVIVQKPGRAFFGIGTYGGNIIDADLQRAPGDPDRDHFEELIPGINIENTSHYTDMLVLNDGSNCSPASVRFTGVDDIFDFVNGSSAIRDMGFTFPDSADDRDLDVTVQTDYTLATGNRYVRMDTTIRNLDAAPLDIYFVEYINGSGETEMWRPAYGFGEPLATLSCPPATYRACNAGSCDPCSILAFSGEDGGAGVSYGYIHGVNGTSEVTVSGVVVPALGQEVAAVFLGAGAPNFHMGAGGLPGDSVTITRYFAVGDGTVASIYDVRNEIQAITSGSISGTVTAGGQPVADADVAVIGTAYPGGPDKNVENHFRTGADGTYAGALAVGSYEVRVNKDGRLLGSPDPANVAIVAGVPVVQNFTLPAPGRLRVTVVDENGDSIPAKVQLVGFDPSPDPRNEQDVLGAISNTTGVFGDLQQDGLPFGIAAVHFADKDGDTGFFDIEPGDYQVAVSRGPRYSGFTQNVTIGAGSTSVVNAQIAKVIDTPGYVTADFHVHAISSPDSEVTNAERVATMLAEGMDFFPATDHDFRSDFGPVIDDMGVAHLISTTTSAEITTFDYGHFNAWPVNHDPGQIQGGVVDHGGAVATPGLDFPEYGNYSLSPEQLIASAHADMPGNVVQINHMYSHFDRNGLLIDTAEAGTGPPQSHVDPLVRRLDPSLSNLFSADFDALEVWIGTNGREGYEGQLLGVNMGDWFNLINQGIVRTGLTSSDTHERRNTQVNARSYVASAVTAPGLLDDHAHVIAGNVAAGRLTGTNGPFVTVSAAAASTGDSAGLGIGQSTMLGTTDGAVDVTVTVHSPLWAPFDRIEFYVNNAPQPFDDDADAGTPNRYGVIPDVVHAAGSEFTVTTVNDFPAIPAAGHLEATTTLNLTGLAEDTWVVALVAGTDGVSRPLFPFYPNDLSPASNSTLADLTDGNLGEVGMTAIAYTNPLLIDADDDGQWEAPGVMLKPPLP